MNLELIKDLGFKNINYVRKDTGKQDRKSFGLYKCFCGNEFEAQTASIKNKKTKSCGCLKIKHNLYSHRLYRTWTNIKQRCFNSKHKAYKDYGARGITICNEWLNNFMSFYNWAIENGYQDNLTIDRINNNGNYEPSNCRWESSHIQNTNKRLIMKTNQSGYRGVSLCKKSKKYKSQISLNYNQIYLGIFNTSIEAAKAYDNYILENNLQYTKNFN